MPRLGTLGNRVKLEAVEEPFQVRRLLRSQNAPAPQIAAIASTAAGRTGMTAAAALARSAVKTGAASCDGP